MRPILMFIDRAIDWVLNWAAPIMILYLVIEIVVHNSGGR